jgi:hypothetical protein
MRLGNMLVEAKPTESGFQSTKASLIARYRDMELVSDLSELTVRNGKFGGYQLIRGTLAAYAAGRSFCVFCDSRRPDLIESWYRVIVGSNCLHDRNWQRRFWRSSSNSYLTSTASFRRFESQR